MFRDARRRLGCASECRRRGGAAVLRQGRQAALPSGPTMRWRRFSRTAAIVWKEKMSAGTNKHKRKVMLQEGNRTPGPFCAPAMTSRTHPVADLWIPIPPSWPPTAGAAAGSRQRAAGRASQGRQPADLDRECHHRCGAPKAGEEPADPEGFERQVMDMIVFDNLIANTDRNPGTSSSTATARSGSSIRLAASPVRKSSGMRTRSPAAAASCGRSCRASRTTRSATRSVLRQGVHVRAAAASAHAGGCRGQADPDAGRGWLSFRRGCPLGSQTRDR